MRPATLFVPMEDRLLADLVVGIQPFGGETEPRPWEVREAGFLKALSDALVRVKKKVVEIQGAAR